MINRRTGLTTFVLILFALVAAGVFSEPRARPVAEIGLADAFECAPPYGEYVEPRPLAELETGPRPSPGTVPSSFTPVTVVVCDNAITGPAAADGTAHFIETHYGAEPLALTDALNAPSARRSLFPGACDTSTYSMPALLDTWLVDADGRAMEPSYPLSDCGFARVGVLWDALPQVEATFVEHKVHLTDEDIRLLYSCSPVPTSQSPQPGPLCWPN
ncbi:hypothetical protein [Rhodococcus sp. 077-4]|uniref:hypothetical protein n=1 Tax=Rhodococcus sp. 077-4 TaxID=2789271 RepID=UPI0039F4C883